MIFFAFLLSAAVCGSSAEKFTRSSEDLLKIEDLTFGLAFWGENWENGISQHRSPSSVVFPGEGAEKTQLGLSRRGRFQTPASGTFEFSETVRKISDTEQELHLELRSAEGVSTAMLVLKSSVLPLSVYKERPALFNGRKILPEVKKQFSGSPGKNGSLLRIPLKYGTLTITGNFQIRVPHIQQGVEFRLCFTPYSGIVKKAVLDLHLKYEPYPAVMLDLRPGANMGFTDETADDGKGGWTDQGPKNDLRSLPVGIQKFAGIPFDIIDPKTNGGKSCLAFRGRMRPSFLESAKIHVPDASGRFLHLLNAVGWEPANGFPVGRIRVTYNDGTTAEHEVLAGRDTGNFWNPFNGEKRVVVWKGRNASASIGLYATGIALDPQKKVETIEIFSADQVWMVVAATITDRLPEKESQIVLRPGREWIPLDSATSVEKGSIADFSFLADAPAGKYGFLKINGEHFEFEKRPGVPVRFWGTNFCFTALYAKAEYTVQVLDDLVRNGYNSVRLHHFDGILTKGECKRGAFDPERWKQLDFFVAEAKKRGLYITLDLYTSSHEAAQARHGNLSSREYKALCYFDPDVRNDFIRFGKTLFDHVNPYTGTAWRDEPAIILLNLINEGTLTRTTAGMTPRVRNAVEKAFRTFLGKRGLPAEPLNSGAHWNLFLAETGKEFFEDVKKKLGLKIPLSDQNYLVPALDTRNTYDYVDAHLYWAHPSFIGSRPWRLPAFTTTQSAISAWGGTIGTILARRILGKPMTITEWNHCYPNPTYYDGPFLVAACSSMQDFGGLWQFAYSHSGDFYFKPGPLGSFDQNQNPVLLHAMRMGALLFLRGDVSPSPITLAFAPDVPEQTVSRMALLSRVGLCWNSVPGVNAEIISRSRKAKTAAPSFIAERTSSLVRKLAASGILPAGTSDFSQNQVCSVTGELQLDAERQIFQMVTPRSESILASAKTERTGKILTVRIQDAFAAISLASMDGKPLSQSRRMLLLHLTENKSEGAVFRDSSMSVQEKSGSSKQLLRRNRADVLLKLKDKFRVFACTGTGKRLFEVPVKPEKEGFLLALDNASAPGGVLLYELLREEPARHK